MDYGLILLGALPGLFIGYWAAIIKVKFGRAGRGWNRPT
jgi:hypothetical protein